MAKGFIDPELLRTMYFLGAPVLEFDRDAILGVLSWLAKDGRYMLVPHTKNEVQSSEAIKDPGKPA